MRHIDAAAVHAALDYPALIERLREAFLEGGEVPLRQHYQIANPVGADGLLLVMPAWQSGRHVGIKMVSVYPDNPGQGLPSVIGAYILFDARNGQPKAVIDGVALTLRRTGCASALAAGYLARGNAHSLLMVGAGALAPHLVRAHLAVRRYGLVTLWNRDMAKAEKLARDLADLRVRIRVLPDLEPAVREADVISCATLSQQPLIKGAWLKPGTHLDLVGGFTPQMREADDEAVQRARVYVDTRAGALKEAGDIIQPLASGLLREADLGGDLFGLVRGEAVGRRDEQEITLFKSVGFALEDLAAAELTYEVAS
ncbi:ornithine cyclodeaminase family protein [Ferrovibrio sp.]|uniref:ornithine cyclodeaminase family protein n=1 Tax=Ferrovibrio sp. TaxID=1917215 RepID=UPI0025C4E7BE|nr:ornithine cyclodeaminase family protein [Ferrovibrio sp.]MBX3456088.1 ornithine cyclodeaminase family protein [Ferrovibrio sp.]